MKALLRTFIVSLLLVVGSTTQGWAQFRTTYPVSDPAYTARSLELPAMTLSQQTLPYAGNHLMDAGKAMTFVGAASLFSMSCLWSTLATDEILGVYFGDFDLSTMETIDAYAGSVAIASGIALLTGIPMWIIGRSRQSEPDGYQYLGTPKGFGMRVDVTGSLAPVMGVDFVAGYHYNPHFFLGLGVGQRFLNGYIVPVYADFRMTLVDKRVSPYVGIDLGGAYYQNRDQIDPFFGLNAGVRIRNKEKDQSRGDWWIAAVYELSDVYGRNAGLRVGYSF